MARRNSTSVICAVVVLAVICATLRPVQAASVFKRNAPVIEEDGTTKVPVRDCAHREPCGWGVYQPFTRIVNYFMRNACKCTKELSCERHEDDVSVSAYVYRCTIPTEVKDRNQIVQVGDHQAGDTNI